MPLYTFYNEKEDMYAQEIVKYDDLEQFLKERPGWVKCLSSPNFNFGGVGETKNKTPGWLRDRFRDIDNKHNPASTQAKKRMGKKGNLHEFY